jgi:hypothetical protein
VPKAFARRTSFDEKKLCARKNPEEQLSVWNLSELSSLPQGSLPAEGMADFDDSQLLREELAREAELD